VGGQPGAFVVPPGDTRVDGAILAFKASAADTRGALSVCEFRLGPWESGPVLHKHEATDEGFFVVSGVLEAQLGEGRVQAASGSFVWVPGGVAHAFANGGPDPLQVLALALPGGIEELFREQAAYFATLDGAPPDVEVLREMGERYGAPTLGPPIRSASAPERAGPPRYGTS
jgi:mannose-6-phosphate isomerase-like protein (cupin superfamily)